MRQSKRILSLVLSVLFALTLLPLTAGAAVKIAPPKQTQYVDIGGTAQLAFTVSGGKKASSLPITYVSDNPAVATVDETGMLIGITKGIANITVTYDTQTIKVPVYVCETFVTYTDKKTYKMSVPESWVDAIGELGDELIRCAYGVAAQNAVVLIMTIKLDLNLTPAQYAAIVEAQNKEKPSSNFQLISSKKTTISGRDGWTLVYTITDDTGKLIKNQMTYTIKNKVVYSFVYGAEATVYDQYAIEVKRMLESLKLLK